MNDTFGSAPSDGPLPEPLVDQSELPPQQDEPPFTRHPDTASLSTVHADTTPSLPLGEWRIPATAGPDFALDDLDPADRDSEQAERHLWASDLDLLAEHHSSDRSHSYLVAHDGSVTWGIPGAPQLVAITIGRDLERRTFTLDSKYHAGLPFAQAWLIERGCPPDHITVPDGKFIEAADDLTLRTERKVREAAQRYETLDTYTRDYDAYESWTLARDTLAPQNPIRLFLEQSNPEESTYAVREGAFPDEDAAQKWLEDRSTPLPPAPEDHLDADALRTRVALARSTGAPHATACGLDTLPTPSTSPVQQPGPGRSQ